MFDKLGIYQTRFWLENKTVKIIEKSSSRFLLELFSKVDDLTDRDLVYYDNAMDMETCFDKYSFQEHKWHQTPNGDMEWVYMLNRQGYLVDLAIAFYLTKKEKFFEKWKLIVFDFIETNEAEISHPEASWRVLDAGIRLMNWIKSLTYLPLDKLTEVEKARIHASMKKHADYIRSHLQEKHLLSNWGVLAVSGLLSFVYFDTKELEMREWAKKTLMQQAALQFTPKGLHWEQSPLYHHEVVMCYAYLYQVAETLDNGDSDVWKNILRNPVQATYYLSNSKQELLALNDSDVVDFSWVQSYYHLLGFDSVCTDYETGLIFAGNNFNKQHDVCFNSFFFDEVAGLAVVKQNDLYFTLFGGMHGSSHGHASQGGISLEMNGVHFITPPGRYSYTECDERISFKSEYMQNSVLVKDGAYPSIESSWGYHWLAEPIFMMAKKKETTYFFECSWRVPLTNDGVKNTITRKIILDTDAKLVVIIDEDMFRNAVTQNFIVPTRKSSDIYSRFWTNGEMSTDKVYYSKRYNTQEEGNRLTIKNQSGIMLTCIASEPYFVAKENILRLDYQNEFRGIKLNCRTDHGELTVYYAPEDISNGLKYMKDSDGNLIYGKLNIIKEGVTIRLL